MTRVEVWPVIMHSRPEMIILGGTKQARARALFCILLPPKGTFTASEVVKRALPHKDQMAEYRAHYRALYDLANDKGITGKNEGDPGPDNVDEHGSLLLGTRGHPQRPRWNVCSWTAIISDEIHAWCVAFNFDLQTRVASNYLLYGRKMKYFCDLDTFEITEELLPSNEQPEAIADLGPCWDETDGDVIQSSKLSCTRTAYCDPEQYKTDLAALATIRKQKYEHWKAAQVATSLEQEKEPRTVDQGRPFNRIAAWLTMTAAVILVAICLPHPENPSRAPVPPPEYEGMLTTSELTLDLSDYVEATRDPVPIYPGTRPPARDKWAATWEAEDLIDAALFALLQPPPMFFAGNP